MRRVAKRGAHRASDAGFTLIEVLLAVLLLGLVVGSLVVSVQQNLAALVGARAELERVRLAEAGLRDLEEAVAAGTAPQPGQTQGTFEPPDEGYAWLLAVEPYAVPLPADAVKDPPLSSVFTAPTNPTPGVEPSVMRVEYRVFPVDGTPDDGEPFVLLLVTPLPAELSGAGAAGANGEGANAGEIDEATREQMRQLRRATEGSSR
jgi:prepilin-type N-terminal cleavage/methylation domain-containing protein